MIDRQRVTRFLKAQEPWMKDVCLNSYFTRRVPKMVYDRYKVAPLGLFGVSVALQPYVPA